MTDFFYVLGHTEFQGAGQFTPQGRTSWSLWSAVDSLGIYFWFDINCEGINFKLFSWTGIEMVCLGLVPQRVWLKRVLPFDMRGRSVQFSHSASQSTASFSSIKSKGVQSCTMFIGVSLALADRLISISSLLWLYESLCLCSLLILGDLRLLRYYFSLLQLLKVLGYL